MAEQEHLFASFKASGKTASIFIALSDFKREMLRWKNQLTFPYKIITPSGHVGPV